MRGIDAVLVVNDLRKSYSRLCAVDVVSFDVRRGEVFGILGPNGAGKTTTLEMVEGLRRPDSGSIRVLGLDPLRDGKRVKQEIGVQLQSTAFFERLTVAEILGLFGSFYRRRCDVNDLLALVQLEAKRTTSIPDLSGGQRQRLSIGLALVNDPRLLILDEPTSSLDPQARLHLWDVIHALRRRGTTLLLTTHSMEEAEKLCDRVAIMDAGRIIALGSPQDLIHEHAPGATLEFDARDVPVDLLRSLPCVANVKVEDDRVFVFTNEAERVLADVVASSREWQFPLANLSLRGPTLEDAFLSMTGRSLRD